MMTLFIDECYMLFLVTYKYVANTVCLLDATKAFDCVRYDKLFELLLKKDIPGTVIRLLLGKGG